MKTFLALIAIVVLTSIVASGRQDIESNSHDSTCTFDAERPDLPGCIVADTSGKLSITSRYVRELPFDRFGLAPVYSHKYGWMYANRTGIVVVSGVYGFDDWADEFHGGLVRVTRKGKFGFANRKGAIVIAAVYDGAFSFKNGSAIVCRQCRCERSGEHCVLRSGEWFRIDVSGKTLERLPQQP
jgi:hypothetical protein